MGPFVVRTLCLLILLMPSIAAMGQEVDWKRTIGEAVDTLQHYLRFNTTNPPARGQDAMKAKYNFKETLMGMLNSVYRGKNCLKHSGQIPWENSASE